MGSLHHGLIKSCKVSCLLSTRQASQMGQVEAREIKGPW